jgi:hypothetical protein
MAKRKIRVPSPVTVLSYLGSWRNAVAKYFNSCPGLQKPGSYFLGVSLPQFHPQTVPRIDSSVIEDENGMSYYIQAPESSLNDYFN